MGIRISKKVRQKIIDHAKSEAPIEACGYLAGNDSEATEIFQMTNSDNSPEHYSFIPEEQFKAFKRAREMGLELIAVYHSHPKSPARMSKEDIKLAYDPNVSYVIVSLMNNSEDIKSFKIKDGLTEEELEVI